MTEIIEFSDFINICRFCLARVRSRQANKLYRIFYDDGTPTNELAMGAIRNCLGFEVCI